MLFAILAGIAIIISGIGAWAEWKVQPVQPRVVMTEKVDTAGNPIFDLNGNITQERKIGADGHPEVELVPYGKTIEPRSLLNSDGIYWMLSSMLRNFTSLPSLGLVFVAILGIGLAEKFGFFSALMRSIAFITPKRFIAPMVVFIGANASVASDAGYVILPPLAAALFS